MPTAERRAYVCAHKSHGELPIRVFLAPGEPEPPECPEGHKMQRQGNVPYERPVPGQVGKPKRVTRRKPQRPSRNGASAG